MLKNNEPSDQTDQITERVIDCGNRIFLPLATGTTLERFATPVAYQYVCVCTPSTMLHQVNAGTHIFECTIILAFNAKV